MDKILIAIELQHEGNRMGLFGRATSDVDQIFPPPEPTSAVIEHHHAQSH
jgi:hypothetical protein